VGRERITISEAARRAGLTPRAVRLYEALGILAPVARTSSGYRTYTDDDVELLRFVRRARELGLQLEEVRAVVELHRRGEQPSRTVVGLLEAHVHDTDRRIADLTALRQALTELLVRATSAARRGEPVHLCCLTR
jgi:MerR family copper efflux transcriptional regulator